MILNPPKRVADPSPAIYDLVSAFRRRKRSHRHEQPMSRIPKRRDQIKSWDARDRGSRLSRVSGVRIDTRARPSERDRLLLLLVSEQEQHRAGFHPFCHQWGSGFTHFTDHALWETRDMAQHMWSTWFPRPNCVFHNNHRRKSTPRELVWGYAELRTMVWPGLLFANWQKSRR